MEDFQEILRQQYHRAYTRLNVIIDPRQISPLIWRQFDLTYGPFLQRVAPGGRVLDLGCGSGFLMYWLNRQPGIVPVGVDSSPSQVRQIRELLPGLEIEQADGLEYLRTQRESFDGIFCLDVLEHLPATELCYQWLMAARQALRPGGFFFCRVPNAANITAGYSRYIDLTHYRSFTSRSMIQLLEAAGFERHELLSMQEAHLRGKLRHWIEHNYHRVLFRLSLHAPENNFTPFLCAAAFKE